MEGGVLSLFFIFVFSFLEIGADTLLDFKCVSQMS